VKRREISLLIDSVLENVSLVGLCVNRICADLGFTPADCYNVELCVVEAVSNSVLHAYGGEAGHPVIARMTADESRLEIAILDQGTEVPMAQRAPAALDFDPDDLASIPEGGRGLFLIHALMDQVEFGKEGDTNVLRMKKAVPRRC
jgi:serine/threonine-protein kinase RsbW